MAHLLCFASLLVIVLFAILSAIEFKVVCLTTSDEKATLLSYHEAHKRAKKLAHSINNPTYVHVGSNKANFAAQVKARLKISHVAFNKLVQLKSSRNVNQVQRRIKSNILVNQLKSSIEWFDWLNHLLRCETQFRLTRSCVQDVLTSIEATQGNSNPKSKARFTRQLAASKQALAEHKQFMVKALDSLKADVTPTQAERDKFKQDEQLLHDKSLAIYEAKPEEFESSSEQLESKNPFYKGLKVCERLGQHLYRNPKAYLAGAAAVGLAVAAYAPNYIMANRHKTAQLIDQDPIEMRA